MCAARVQMLPQEDVSLLITVLRLTLTCLITDTDGLNILAEHCFDGFPRSAYHVCAIGCCHCTRYIVVSLKLLLLVCEYPGVLCVQTVVSLS